MGRSVDYLSNASDVSYAATEFGYCKPYNDETGETDESAEAEFCEWQAREDWNDFKENLEAALNRHYPSLQVNFDNRTWYGETNIIASNRFAEVGLAEYCGLISLSIRPRDDAELEGLAAQWASAVNLDKVLASALGKQSVLRRLGTMSNGEGVFQRAA